MLPLAPGLYRMDVAAEMKEVITRENGKNARGAPIEPRPPKDLRPNFRPNVDLSRREIVVHHQSLRHDIVRVETQMTHSHGRRTMPITTPRIHNNEFIRTKDSIRKFEHTQNASASDQPKVIVELYPEEVIRPPTLSSSIKDSTRCPWTLSSNPPRTSG